MKKALFLTILSLALSDSALAYVNVRPAPPGRGVGGVYYERVRPKPRTRSLQAPAVSRAKETPRIKRYRKDLKKEKVRKRAMNIAPEDQGLAETIELDPQTEEVHNPTEEAFDFSIDTFAAWVPKLDAVKLGISPVLWSTEDSKWAVNLDVAEDLVGGSLNHRFVDVIRLSLGLGYGYSFGSEGKALDARGDSRSSWYAKASLRLW